MHKSTVPLLLCVLCRAALADAVVGEVVGVSDGDTITVLTDNRDQKVRLAGIDAPETRQPHGLASKKHLSDLVYGRTVTLDCKKPDRYKRRVCSVMRGEQDVGLAQMTAGMAWWYRQYAHEQPAQLRTAYSAAEVEARLSRRGLWANQTPVPPWDWRRK